jgi:hypothetical protein
MLLDAQAMALITESMREHRPRLNLSPRVAARASVFWRRGSVEEALELARAGKPKTGEKDTLKRQRDAVSTFAKLR